MAECLAYSSGLILTSSYIFIKCHVAMAFTHFLLLIYVLPHGHGIYQSAGILFVGWLTCITVSVVLCRGRALMLQPGE